ncbi:MAG: PTS sugar transporter subunit IIA [Pseudomonadota bacterium]
MLSHREKLRFNFILPNLDLAGKKQVFDVLASGFSENSDIKKSELVKAFLKQEAQSSSGIGDGIALPHLQIENINSPVSALIKLKRPIDFKGVDDTPVDIVCCVISPKADGPHHLRRLSRLSRLLRDSDFCDNVRNTDDIKQLQDLFLEYQKQILMAA